MSERTCFSAIQRATRTFLSSSAFKWLALLIISISIAGLTTAQTTQPFVFTAATVNNGPGIAAFVRDDTTGVLTLVAGSPFVVRDAPTAPMIVDALGRWIFAGRASGRICVYQLSSQGQVAETANSPYSSSITNVLALPKRFRSLAVYEVSHKCPENISHFLIVRL